MHNKTEGVNLEKLVASSCPEDLVQKKEFNFDFFEKFISYLKVDLSDIERTLNFDADIRNQLPNLYTVRLFWSILKPFYGGKLSHKDRKHK